MKQIFITLILQILWNSGLQAQASDKWWIVMSSENHLCAKIPPPSKTHKIDMNPEALKKHFPGCVSSSSTIKGYHFLMLNCPNENPDDSDNFIYTSTKSFCENWIDFDMGN